MTMRWMAAIMAWLSLSAGAAEMDYHLAPKAVAPEVYVFFGKTEDFTTTNGGNIVNTSFIVAPQGVIVIDTGPSLRYGRQMRAAIARVTDKPVVMVFNTHHHPDHFLGNQAFAGIPIATLAGVRQGIVDEGNAFAENLYRMSGDWLAGTEAVAPDTLVEAGVRDVAGVRLRLIALSGHTGADLAIYDETHGALFAGDLVFNRRAPTTPHADIGHWLESLTTLERFMADNGVKVLVPGHGEATRDSTPIRRTRAWLVWLRDTLRQAANDGLDMNETLARPLPEQFRDMPMAHSEYRRSVETLFPRFEIESLGGARATP